MNAPVTPWDNPAHKFAEQHQIDPDEAYRDAVFAETNWNDLPPYAATPVGRALLAEIIASQPEGRMVRDEWGIRDTPRYTGKPAAMLRRLHDEWMQREMAVLEQQYAVTHIWSEDDATAILGVEQPDALIKRVLAEPVSVKRAA